MDRIYEGFWLHRIERKVTKEEMVNVLLQKIGEDPDFYENGQPAITLFPLGQKSRTRNALVRGVRLPLRQIKSIIGRAKIRNGPLNLRGPDFGVEHDEAGHLVEGLYPTHHHLLQGYGFLPPIDIFWPVMSTRVGGVAKLKTTLYVNCLKDKLNTSGVREYGCSMYGNTRNPYAHPFRKLETGKETFAYDCTEMEFGTVFEALQAMCWLNGSIKFMVADRIPRFFTGAAPTALCKIVRTFGLARDHGLLRIRDYADIGYVPFEAMNPDVLCEQKLESIKFICRYCKTKTFFLGIDFDLGWIAANCQCPLETLRVLGYIHNEETFMRIIIPFIGKRRSGADGHRVTMPPGAPLMPVIKSRFDSVHESVSVVYSVFLEEFREQRRQLTLCSTPAEILTNTFKQTHSVIGRERNIHVVSMRVKQTKLWCPAGLNKMRGITLQGMVGRGMMQRNVEGVVFDILMDVDFEGTCIVWAEILLKSGESIDAPLVQRVVPKPPTSTKDSIQRALKLWSKTDHFDQFVLHQFHGHISSVRVLGSTAIQRTLFDILAINLPLASSPITDALQDHITRGNYVGMDISVPVSVCGRTFVLEDFARVASIVDDEFEAQLQLFMKVPQNHHVLCGAVVNFRLWVLTATGVEETADNFASAIPGGAEDDEEDSDDDDIDQDVNDQDEDDALRDDEDMELVRLVPRPPTNTAGDGIDIAYSLGILVKQRLPRPVSAVDVDTPLYEIAKSFKRSPKADFSFGNLLLRKPTKAITPLANLSPPPSSTKINLVGSISSLLNQNQRQAVDRFIFNRASITQGPPGCGKTMTAVLGACMLHCMEKGYMLMVAPSNTAADVMFSKMLFFNKQLGIGMRIIRLVTPNREVTYRDSPGDDNDVGYLHHYVMRDDEWLGNETVKGLLAKSQNAGVHLTTEERNILNDLKAKIAVKKLQRADVIVCTTACMSDLRLKSFQKSILDKERKLLGLICDESSLLQIPMAIPMLGMGSRRLWILGDHFQLSPQVSSFSARTACLDISFMENLMLSPYPKEHGVFTLLSTQYRMADSIGRMTSGYMYRNKVKSSSCVLSRRYGGEEERLRLPEFRHCNAILYTYANFAEQLSIESTSYHNPTEVEITAHLVQHLYSCGYKMCTVSVISMYEAQIMELRKTIFNLGPDFEQVEIGTVDSYQGKKNDFVIVNLVRSNDKSEVGFLADRRRINVAMSRAKHFLLVVGHLGTIRGSQDESLLSLVKQWQYGNINVVEFAGNPPVRKFVARFSDYVSH